MIWTLLHVCYGGFKGGSVVKNLPANAGDTGSIPGSGRSPRGGHGNPLQYSYLENPMDRETRRVTVHRVTESQTWLRTRKDVQFSSVAQCPTLWPHGLQHARPPCPSPTPGVYSNSCPLSWWCHPTISSSVIPFSSCPQSFPASGSFPMSQLFASGGQKYWSFSFNISPSNEYSGLISFRMDWLCLLAVQGTLKSLLQHCSSKASILQHSAFFIVQLSHPYMTTGINHILTRQTFIGKIMSLLFNMLSRLVITYLPRSKRLLISWLQSPSAVILEPRKIKSATVSPSSSQEVMGPDAIILVFWMLSFKSIFFTFLFHFHQEAL